MAVLSLVNILLSSRAARDANEEDVVSPFTLPSYSIYPAVYLYIVAFLNKRTSTIWYWSITILNEKD